MANGEIKMSEVKSVTIKQALESISDDEVQSWIAEIADRSISSSGSLQSLASSCFIWAVKAALEKLAPITILPDPEEYED
jgi:hypothetical protein